LRAHGSGTLDAALRMELPAQPLPEFEVEALASPGMQRPVIWGSLESLTRFPSELPPAAPWQEESAFKAGSLHHSEAVKFWLEEVLPTVNLAPKEADIIKELIQKGLSISDKFEEFTGMLCDGSGPTSQKWVADVAAPPKANFVTRIPTDPIHEAFMDAEIAKLLRQGVIEVTTEAAAHVILPVMIAENSGGKLRAIVDGRYINSFMNPDKFKLPSVGTIVDDLSEGDLMIKIDIRSGYYNLLIQKQDKQYVCFEWRGVIYCFNAAVMGLNITPYHFQLITDTLRSYICIKLNIKGFVYLDDYLFAIGKAATVHEQKWIYFRVHEAMRKAGLICAQPKCSPEFTTGLTMLGFDIDSIKQHIEVPEAKLAKTLGLLEAIIPATAESEGAIVNLSVLQSLLGKLTHLTVAAPPVAMFLVMVHAEVAQQKPVWATLSSVTIRISKETSSDMRTLLHLKKWARLTRWESAFKRKLSMTTDASGHAWGACMFIEGQPVADYGGVFPEFARKEVAIHIKERLAIDYAMQLMPPDVTNAYIRIHTDNEIVRFTVLKGQRHDAEARMLARRLLHLQMERNIIIKVLRITTKKNIRADTISRFAWLHVPVMPSFDRADQMLERSRYMMLQSLFQMRFTIDAFASSRNRQCDRYVSLQSQGFDKPVAINAFNYGFTNEVVYANPPFAIISAVWKHFKDCKARGVLLAPRKTAARWYPKLHQECTRFCTLAAAGSRDILLQASTSYTRSVGPLPWDLMAFEFDFRGK
jgi:predicted regulator of amino acid metabolism with ACT domain